MRNDKSTPNTPTPNTISPTPNTASASNTAAPNTPSALAPARLRCDRPGFFRVKRGNGRSWGFKRYAFINHWYGDNPGKTKGIHDWFLSKGIDWLEDVAMCPSDLKRAESHAGRYVTLRRLSSGWGGARASAGRHAINMLPELREECIRQVIASNNESAYLRYEAEWERVNGRRSPKSLLAGFRAELRKRQSATGDGRY